MGRVQVTLKASAGYDAPWITLEGETVQDTIGLLESMLGVEGAGMSLVQLATEGASVFSGHYAAARNLGGRVIPENAPEKPSEAPVGDAQTATAPPAAEQPTLDAPEANLDPVVEQLSGQLAGCTSKEDVQRLYIRSREVLANRPELGGLFADAVKKMEGK